MRTSDPDIFAVGDAVEVRDFVTGQWSLVALAGPANRQGRIAADVIAGREFALPWHAGDRNHRARSGRRRPGPASARRRSGSSATRTTRRSTSSRIRTPGYYPGAKPLALKFIFRKSDGRVLGAQALGEDGPAVDKRISALAVAIQMGATIYDLEEAELCYAPQFGSAKDRRQLRRDGRRGCSARRHAARPLGAREGRVPARRARAGGTGRRSPCRARSTSRSPSFARAWTSCLATGRSSSSAVPAQRAYYATRDPAAARVQGPHAFRGDVGASHASGCRGIRCDYHQERQGRPKGRISTAADRAQWGASMMYMNGSRNRL